MTSEQLEAENRDLLFLMMHREPRLIDRLMRRFLKCIGKREGWDEIGFLLTGKI